ncbi:MAG: hypothetical protein II131_03180 [Neisseriaceae bacterium]|nr:hypothetical protein [Neisseriaceae bacterium]
MNILRKLLPLSLITAGFLTACSPNEQARAIHFAIQDHLSQVPRSD